MLLNFKCKQILLKQGLLFVNEVIKILVNVFHLEIKRHNDYRLTLKRGEGYYFRTAWWHLSVIQHSGMIFRLQTFKINTRAIVLL